MTQIVDPNQDSHTVNVTEHASLINTLSANIAGNTASIDYQKTLATPDHTLIIELEALLAAGIEKLKEVWTAAKAAGEAFFQEVYGIVKGFFTALFADLEKFLELFGIKL